MLSIKMMAVATIAHATSIALPVKATNCIIGRTRMNRVSVSDFRNTRRSGNIRSSFALIFCPRRVRTERVPFAIPLQALGRPNLASQEIGVNSGCLWGKCGVTIKRIMWAECGKLAKNRLLWGGCGADFRWKRPMANKSLVEFRPLHASLR